MDNRFKSTDIEVYCTYEMFIECKSLRSPTRALVDISDTIDRPSPHGNFVTVKIYRHDINPSIAAPWQLSVSNSRTIQFMILRNGLEVKKWVRDTADISFLTSFWCEGKFHLSNERELITRTGTITPNYIGSSDRAAIQQWPQPIAQQWPQPTAQQIYQTIYNIAKYTDYGFQITNIDEFISRVARWLEQMTIDAIVDAPDEPVYTFAERSQVLGKYIDHGFRPI